MTHVGKELLYPILDTSACATNGRGQLDFTIPKQVGLKAPKKIFLNFLCGNLCRLMSKMYTEVTD